LKGNHKKKKTNPPKKKKNKKNQTKNKSTTDFERWKGDSEVGGENQPEWKSQGVEKNDKCSKSFQDKKEKKKCGLLWGWVSIHRGETDMGRKCY